MMHPRQQAFVARRLGFSLLELSVVIGVIALIAGAGMKMADGALKAADRITTQERLETIKTALDSYAKAYGYLPCPADRTLVPTSTNFGVESRAGSNCTAVATGVVLSGSVWLGAVPVRTLGLPDNYAADAWSNKLTYAVTDNLKSKPRDYSFQSGAITLRYGDRTTYYTITSQRTTGTITGVTDSGGLANLAFSAPHGIAAPGSIIVHVAGSVYKGSFPINSIPDATHLVLTYSNYSATDTGTASWQTVGPDVAYVVVSHGADGRGAFPMAANAIPSTRLCNNSAVAASSPAPCLSNATTTCIDIENCNDDDIFYDTAFNNGAVAAQYFDDYIVWGSNSLARAPVNPILYFDGATGCPAGTCETWCAVCGVNYPGAGATAPPASITSGVTLYKKIITTNATTCSASCFWGGLTASGYIKKP